jgi:hypothetical protein
METQVVYSVEKNTDGTEGRGTQVDTGIYFTTKADAVTFTNSNHYKRYAVMGYVDVTSKSSYNVREKTINVFENIKDFEENSDEMEKAKVLAKIREKLTDAEIQLLGI